MQSLDVISVNIWNIIISLLNLLILFLLIKKFLYKPVLKMLDKRKAEVEKVYSEADLAKENAERDEAYWKEKRDGAKAEADDIMRTASEKASRRSDKIIQEARERADGIISEAQAEAKLEMHKAEEGIKKEIVDVSALLAEKMLSREINIDDHRSLIDSAIEKIGDDND